MNQLANTVIDRLGGTTVVAKICEIKPPSVHEWREKGIPKPRLQFLRIAYPDAFEGLETSDPAAHVTAAPSPKGDA
ncbi:hypothetical protein ACSI5F_03810 [Ralstonia pseudosolanacearum]|uniref:hypothetical protein n=1 Tax=Ralstonia pseudosolanacearum TaxID=1310165 RepID=UPI003EDF2123